MSLSLLRNPRGLAGVLALLVAIHGASAAASTAGDTTFVGDFEAQGRVLREFGSRVLPITSLSDGGDGFFVFTSS